MPQRLQALPTTAAAPAEDATAGATDTTATAMVVRSRLAITAATQIASDVDATNTSVAS